MCRDLLEQTTRKSGHSMSLCPNHTKVEKKKNTNSRRLMLGLPYVQGTSKILARIFKTQGMNMYHKLTNTMRSMLVHPEDKTPKERQYGTIHVGQYHITCNDDPQHTSHNLCRRIEAASGGLVKKTHKIAQTYRSCLNMGLSVSITNTKS